MKRVISILFLLLLCGSIFGQDENGIEQKIEQIEIYFDLNSCVVDSEYRINGASLTYLAELLDQLQRDPLVAISTIHINSYASPDGGRHYNEQITKERTSSIYDYLVDTISVPDSLIVKSHSGIDWTGLYDLVEQSDMQYREEVLYLLNNVPEETWRRVNPTDRWQTLVDSRIKHLMDLKYGRPYHYIAENFFPLLRRGSVITIYFHSIATPMIEEDISFVEDIKIAQEPIAQDPIAQEPAQEVDVTSIETAPIVEPEEVSIVSEPLYSERKQLKFALKTNLLYDIAMMPTIEVEVPIRDRWSVAGEWICPWWETKDMTNTLQILSGNLEGKYWFGNRVNRPVMTGWFASLYAGGGLYDLQYQGDGYQGEFYIAAGLGGGYAHTINRSGNLRLEYSLGVGYLKTNYRRYKAEEDNKFFVWQYSGSYTWVGPTKAKVSLVWLINTNGGRR